jgi:hypothetical protein
MVKDSGETASRIRTNRKTDVGKGIILKLILHKRNGEVTTSTDRETVGGNFVITVMNLGVP